MNQQEPPDRVSAVALSHSARDLTPTVVAKGYGVVAESIIRVARENGLYVHSSPDLVKLLMDVDLDARIPPQLYVAVAEVLAWLHKIEHGQATKDYINAINQLNQTAP
ncbi:MAG: EscU/YscU/HrcU family type III secretion system export apparatus switch protein [Rhodoferax sp.]|nr:EscU/YscU/HrcU family type III secretion system export apparatus switch protein [Rhodoferax sp.]